MFVITDDVHLLAVAIVPGCRLDLATLVAFVEQDGGGTFGILATEYIAGQILTVGGQEEQMPDGSEYSLDGRVIFQLRRTAPRCFVIGQGEYYQLVSSHWLVWL